MIFLDANVTMDVAAIIAAVGTIIATTLSYKQHRDGEKAKQEAQERERRMEDLHDRRTENSAKVFGAIWRLLYLLKADRVYIVQPHPLGHASLLSIQFEVHANGIEEIKESIHELPMSEVPSFSEQLVNNVYMYIDNIDEKIEDRVCKAILRANGSEGLIVKRLNNTSDWVGSIFCEYTSVSEMPDSDEARRLMHDVAMMVQYILPEYKKIKK